MSGFAQPVSPIFLDLNPQFDGSPANYYTVNALAIASQIFNLFTTTVGECEGEPLFGSLLPYRLFEPIDDITAWGIETDLVIATNTWLGDRITVPTGGIVVLPDPDNQRFLVTIIYQITLTGVTQQLTIALNSMRPYP